LAADSSLMATRVAANTVRSRWIFDQPAKTAPRPASSAPIVANNSSMFSSIGRLLVAPGVALFVS
jgi:hypothetical protein